MSVIPAAKNEPNDIKIRKLRDTLVTGGLAIIAFGIWTVIKSIFEAFTILEPMIGSISVENLSKVEAQQLKSMMEDNSLFAFFFLMILIVLAVDLALRVYVGLSARAVGLQKKKRNGKERKGIVWLIFGIILAAISIYSLIMTLINTSDTLQVYSITYYVVSLFVDLTSIVVTIELVISGFRLRSLDKTQKAIEEVRNAA